MHKRTIAAAGAAGALVLATVSGVGAANAASSRSTLPGSVPAWATSAHRIGAASTSAGVAFRVYLPWRGGDAAARYALKASQPRSRTPFLTPAQFRAKTTSGTAS